MLLKICGITNAEDAAAAVDGGANAIGFNFWARSPRYLLPESAARIDSAAGILRVGVFVNEIPARIEEIARLVRLDVAQLHGDESPVAYPGSMTVWKAARVTAGFAFSDYDDSPAEALVLDGPAGELYGGSGQTFDWGLAAVIRKRIILAGGLDGSNVAQAVAAAHPWGVDACSRIESAPGKKDHQKMKEFLQAAREALRA
jgi:phosphoribosylanthranilate isomerase